MMSADTRQTVEAAQGTRVVIANIDGDVRVTTTPGKTRVVYTANMHSEATVHPARVLIDGAGCMANGPTSHPSAFTVHTLDKLVTAANSTHVKPRRAGDVWVQVAQGTHVFLVNVHGEVVLERSDNIRIELMLTGGIQLTAA